MYIREAHPTDGWKVPQNVKEGIEIKSPKTEQERQDVAGTCVKSLKLSIPCLVDDMKNTAESAYAGWPDRIYVVGKDGKIAYKGEPGPRGFRPEDAEKVLKDLIEAKQNKP